MVLLQIFLAMFGLLIVATLLMAIIYFFVDPTQAARDIKRKRTDMKGAVKNLKQKDR